MFACVRVCVRVCVCVCACVCVFGVYVLQSVKTFVNVVAVLKNDLQKVKKYQKTLKGLAGVQKKFQSDVQVL